jgi:hypothetical protein
MYISAGAAHWVEHDVTATAYPNGIAAMPESPLAAYVQYSNTSQHINFIDGRGHVRELRYDSKDKYWANVDLTLKGCSATATTAPSRNLTRTAALIDPDPATATTPASGNLISTAAIINPGPTCNSIPPVLPGSALAAYWDADDDSQHVDFIAKAGDGSAHVHELFQSPNQFWVDTDLTVASQQSSSVICFVCGPPPAVLPNALHGYSVGSNNSQHLNFIDASGDVHELYGDGNTWSDRDLTALARSRYHASRTTALTGYWEPTDDSQHVNFVSDDGHVHELFIRPNHQPLG